MKVWDYVDAEILMLARMYDRHHEGHDMGYTRVIRQTSIADHSLPQGDTYLTAKAEFCDTLHGFEPKSMTYRNRDSLSHFFQHEIRWLPVMDTFRTISLQTQALTAASLLTN